ASSTQITATSPAGTAAIVDVVVTTPVGTSAMNAPSDDFTYEAAPTVAAVSPVLGPLTGNTTVTVTGTGFTGATAVDFATTSAASFVIVSSTQITASSPLAPAGTVDITVTSSSGTSATSPADEFTYEDAPMVA